MDLGKIKTDYDGFKRIVEIANQITLDPNKGLKLKMTSWVDANMCAPLGAVFHKHNLQGNKIHISEISKRVQEIMQKNHFLSLFGGSDKPDSYHTTIEYKQFENTSEYQHKQFQEYVDKYFKSKRMGLPQMTPALIKRFRESLHEIFLNAMEHSDTKYGIFACGQFFPNLHRLIFTIADLGIGIDGNIEKNLGVKPSSENAIRWALSGKTTRLDRPGGLGLQLIQEFINLNKGRLIIVSGSGYGEIKGGNILTETYSERFPGTVVTISIDTADKKTYCLGSEIDQKTIF